MDKKYKFNQFIVISSYIELYLFYQNLNKIVQNATFRWKKNKWLKVCSISETILNKYTLNIKNCNVITDQMSIFLVQQSKLNNIELAAKTVLAMILMSKLCTHYYNTPHVYLLLHIQQLGNHIVTHFTCQS